MWLYNIAIRIYGLAIYIASFFKEKPKKWIDGRKGWKENLPPIDSQKKVCWFHCASLGEYDQGEPIIKAWKEKYPDHFILITFFSPSGYEHRKDTPLADFCTYLPLDTPHNANIFIKHFNPSYAFFVKYEFWLNHIKACAKNHTKLFLVSGLIHEKQPFFRWYGAPFRKQLSHFDHLFLQNFSSRDLLLKLGISAVTVSGDTRFDKVFSRAENASGDPLIERWKNKETVYVIGSSWEEDEELVIPFIAKKQQKTIIAPHDVGETNIKRVVSQITSHNIPYAKYTEAERDDKLVEKQVLVLDCIGKLALAYQYGKIAHVGGGFGSGLHNILEAAAFGVPVTFGPEYEKFPEAALFIKSGVGISVENQTELARAYNHYDEQIDLMTKKSRNLIFRNRRATEKIMSYFE